MAEAVEAIISIHRGYADAILAGTKTVELRRKLPSVSSGTRLWIYATQPIGAIVGFATIQEVDKASPAAIWRRYRASAGLDYAVFRDYFDGAPVAIAVLLGAVRRIKPIGLNKLRQIRSSFHPPQVLTHLTEPETKALRQLIAK